VLRPVSEKIATFQQSVAKFANLKTVELRRSKMAVGSARNYSFRIVSINLFVAVLSVVARSCYTYAQDLEPRAFANTPVGMNFLIGAYAYSKGTVGTDPSVPLTDTEVKLNSAVLAYVRTLDLRAGRGSST